MTSKGHRRNGELSRAVFQVLMDEPDGLPVGDVLARAEEVCPATPEEDGDYASRPGVRRYPHKLRFGTISAVKAGWLVKDHGVWHLTDKGRSAFNVHADPDDFEAHARQGYQDWVASQPSSQFEPEDAEDTEAAQLEAGEQGQRRAWLVRGANVVGTNVVPTWLAQGFCSIGWSALPDILPGTSRAEIVKLMASELPELSVQACRVQAGNIYRFLNEIATGDIVVTVSGNDVYVGEVVGEPTFVEDALSPRRRAVAWANVPSPFPRTSLSSSAADGLRGQQTVTSLTSHANEFATRGGLDTDLDPVSTDVMLPMPSAALADSLLMPMDWLAETVELLNEKRQLVLYGPPGTGKTYLAQELCKHLVQPAGGEYAVVQFHPSYAYEDFFEGLRPQLNADGSGGIGFSLVPGPLRRIATLAAENRTTPYVLIIDEINRANLAKVFGELYYLLEYRGNSVTLQYSEEFALPRNLFFIGTMNTADRSIALVDAAMRRRFYFQKLFPTEPPVRDVLAKWLTKKGMSNEPAQLLNQLNTAIGDPDFAVGPSYLMTPRVENENGLDRIWRTAILPLLEEHFFGEGRDIAADFGLSSLRRAAELSSPTPVVPDPS